MKNIKKQGFTLVELIVVITILAILGSIAFISLQGYSSDARNSKRTSDLGSLQSALSTQLAQGQAILSFVTSVSANRIDNTLATTAIGGTGIIYGTDYDAGTINYAALPSVKQVDFQDPTEQAYAFGATTKKNGQYELAATIEQGQGAKIAKVQGTYSPR
ncbi:prepilin-type N-terminal cleavage/methylation domain-containing protein, partial [Candidatus Gracilibacteria bacterium]|nr:prepilin-type N-terminal cleavage/methylation domain-containing protein [Candidatus Gracilibacteria bacterium]